MSNVNQIPAPISWDEDNITEMSLDIIPGKFKTTVTNILSKQCCDIKTISEDIIQPASVSKKKLKDLITKHNNEIFAFMSHPDKTPTMLGVAETIFRRYGHAVPSIYKNGVNVLKDLNLDISMNNTISEFDKDLKKIGGIGGGIDAFIKQLRWIYIQYKQIGEEILRQETILHQKLEMLDKLHNRIPLITGLSNNEVLPELIDTFSKYVESIYKPCKIDENYLELVELYKKWNICRQIIALDNFKNNTNEPQCSICLIESVSYAIVPCGHTFCSSCSKKQNTNCYICRGNIRERIKLYYT